MKLMHYCIIILNVIVGTSSMHAMDKSKKSKHQITLNFSKARAHRVLLREREREKAKETEKNEKWQKDSKRAASIYWTAHKEAEEQIKQSDEQASLLAAEIVAKIGKTLETLNLEGLD